jgi:hypothetical protein
MALFSRHKDNRLDGSLEFGCDLCNSQVGSVEEAPTRHYSASVSFFDRTILFTQKKLTIMFTVLTRVPVENLMQLNDGDIRCVRLRGLTDVRGTRSIECACGCALNKCEVRQTPTILCIG